MFMIPWTDQKLGPIVQSVMCPTADPGVAIRSWPSPILSQRSALSHHFLGMGPGSMELGKLAAFWLKLGNLTWSLFMTFPLLD